MHNVFFPIFACIRIFVCARIKYNANLITVTKCLTLADAFCFSLYKNLFCRQQSTREKEELINAHIWHCPTEKKSRGFIIQIYSNKMCRILYFSSKTKIALMSGLKQFNFALLQNWSEKNHSLYLHIQIKVFFSPVKFTHFDAFGFYVLLPSKHFHYCNALFSLHIYLFIFCFFFFRSLFLLLSEHFFPFVHFSCAISFVYALQMWCSVCVFANNSASVSNKFECECIPNTFLFTLCIEWMFWREKKKKPKKKLSAK